MNENTTIDSGDILKPGGLRINDIQFYIPPESISITTTEYDSSRFLLREALPSTLKEGRKRVAINIPLTIDLESPLMGYDVISRLLIQIRKTPVATLENEKIRKELLGPQSKQIVEIPVLIESVTGSIDKEFPSLLRVNISMTWFNHFPYSSFLTYAGDPTKGEAPISKSPTSLYKEFYEYDTLVGGQLINFPDPSFDVGEIEFFYKEYKRFDIGPQEGQGSKGVGSRRAKAEVGTLTATKLKETGWINSSDKWGYTISDNVYYRWKKFTIPISILREGSGPLILEDLSFSLMTNIAYIPLEGYSIPTAQFMGGSMSSLRAIVYAGAEKNTEGVPSGTSDRLAQFQKVLDKVSDNRTNFAEHSREDYIMIKHPLAKLLKYEKFIEPKLAELPDSFYFDEQTKTTEALNYDDLLPVVTSNRSSQTIKGQPFASRFQMDMKETRFRKSERIVELSGGKLSRVNRKDGWIKLLKLVEKEYKITKENDTIWGIRFVVKSNRRNPDRKIAEELAVAMSNMSVLDDSLDSIDKMVKSPYFNQSASRIRKEIKTSSPLRKFSAGDADGVGETVKAGLRETKGNTYFLNTEAASVMVTDLLKVAARDPDKRWSAKYDDHFETVRNYNSVPQSQVYTDIKIPLQRSNPAYYFRQFDSVSANRQKAIRGMMKNTGVVDENIRAKLLDPKAPLRTKPDAESAAGGVSPATNIASINGNEKKHGANHNAGNPAYRASIAGMAVANMSAMTNSMAQAYPAFKVYLKQSDVLFDRELSLSDLSQDKREQIQHGYRDLSESFDISSIIDIRIVKDEKIPGDLMILRIVSSQKDMTNAGAAERRNQTETKKLDYEKIAERAQNASKGDKPSAVEERFAKEGIKEGTRIQARLGYKTNPNDLSTEFNGRIVSVSGREIMEVVCLGNGIELIQDVKGLGGEGEIGLLEEYSRNSDTLRLIEKLFQGSPELTSFGTTGYKTNFGFEIFNDFLGGASSMDNIFAPSLFQGGYSDFTTEAIDGASLGSAITGAISATAIGIVTASATLTGFGITTGVIATSLGTAAVAVGSIAAAPVVAVLAVGIAAGAVLGLGAELYSYIKRKFWGSSFTVYNKNLWELLQELTLRHPGSVVSVVPYDNRSTIFFGQPHDYYFHRGPTPLEAGIIDKGIAGGRFFGSTAREILDDETLGLSSVKTTGDVAFGGTQERSEKRREKRRALKPGDEFTKDQVVLNMMKPFCTHHLVASEHDIVSNKIEVTSRNVANSIQVRYPEDSDDGNFDGSKGFSDYKITRKIQADDDIYAEFIHNKVFTFENAHKETVEDLPERYAKSILCKELSKVYTGKLTILGREGIKPHDIVILRDTYNQISGPIGVSKVVHIFNAKRGWLTEITPKMLVFPDTGSGIYQLANVIKGANYWLASEHDQFYRNLQVWHAPVISDEGGNASVNRIYDREYMDLIGKEDATNYIGEIVSRTGGENDEGVSKGGKLALRTGEVLLAEGATLAARKVIAPGVTSLAKTASGASAKIAATTLESITEAAAARVASFSGAVAEKGLAKTAGKGSLGLIASSFSGVLKIGKTGLIAGGTILAGPAGLVAHLMLDSLIDGFVSWSKYRQPIVFYPLHRQGEAWHAGMNGFKYNDRMDHFSDQLEEGIDRALAYKNIATAMYNEYDKS